MAFLQVVIHGPRLLPSCDFAFARTLDSSASSLQIGIERVKNTHCLLTSLRSDISVYILMMRTNHVAQP